MDWDFHQTKYAPCKSVTIFLVESNAQHGAWKKSGNVLGVVSTADINPRIPGANLQISLILVADLTDNIKTEAYEKRLEQKEKENNLLKTDFQDRIKILKKKLHMLKAKRF